MRHPKPHIPKLDERAARTAWRGFSAIFAAIGKVLRVAGRESHQRPPVYRAQPGAPATWDPWAVAPPPAPPRSDSGPAVLLLVGVALLCLVGLACVVGLRRERVPSASEQPMMPTPPSAIELQPEPQVPNSEPAPRVKPRRSPRKLR